MSCKYTISCDKQLLLLLREDDAAAFSEIYNRHWALLYNSAYKRLRDKEQCKDIIQNVFTDIWNRRKTINIDNLPAYLSSAVRFQVFHYSSKVTAQSAFYELIDVLPSYMNADSKIIDKELAALMDGWVKALPEKRRKIFLMHYKLKFSTFKIAKELDISQKTVQNQLLNASQSLRARLSQLMSLLLCSLL